MKIKRTARERRHLRIREKVSGTSERPRLNVRRSLQNLFIQIIDDGKRATLLSASTADKDFKSKISYGGNVKAAAALGEIVAREAKNKNITRVVFDRGGYDYHGRIKAFADAGAGKVDWSFKMVEPISVTESKEAIEKVVRISRVAKVTKGGKKLSFSALVVVGNTRGKVGVSLGKANEVSDAIRKGIAQAKKSMMQVPLQGTTIPHDVVGRFGSARVILKPAVEGTGIIASGPVRAVCEAAGIKDILTKCLTSNNPLNVILATIEGLKDLNRDLEIFSLRKQRFDAAEGQEHANN